MDSEDLAFLLSIIPNVENKKKQKQSQSRVDLNDYVQFGALLLPKTGQEIYRDSTQKVSVRYDSEKNRIVIKDGGGETIKTRIFNIDQKNVALAYWEGTTKLVRRSAISKGASQLGLSASTYRQEKQVTNKYLPWYVQYKGTSYRARHETGSRGEREYTVFIPDFCKIFLSERVEESEGQCLQVYSARVMLLNQFTETRLNKKRKHAITRDEVEILFSSKIPFINAFNQTCKALGLVIYQETGV